MLSNNKKEEELGYHVLLPEALTVKGGRIGAEKVHWTRGKRLTRIQLVVVHRDCGNPF